MGMIKLEYVIRYSSQDDYFKAENLLQNPGYRPWLCSPKDKSGRLEAEFQLESASCIEFIDIGNFGCCTIEIQVGKSALQKKTTYQSFVPAVSLMSFADVKENSAKNSVYMLNKNNINQFLAEKKWDRIKVICSQPYEKQLQFGLSFLCLRTTKEFMNMTIREDTSADTSNERLSKCVTKMSSASIDSGRTRGEKLLNASKSRLFVMNQRKKLINRVSQVLSRQESAPVPVVISPEQSAYTPKVSPRHVSAAVPMVLPRHASAAVPMIVEESPQSPELFEEPLFPLLSPPPMAEVSPQPSTCLKSFRQDAMCFLLVCYEEENLVKQPKYYQHHFEGQRGKNLTFEEQDVFRDCYFHIVNNQNLFEERNMLNNQRSPLNDESYPYEEELDLKNVKKEKPSVTSCNSSPKNEVISDDDYIQADGTEPSTSTGKKNKPSTTSSGKAAAKKPVPCSQCPMCGVYFPLKEIEAHAWDCAEAFQFTGAASPDDIFSDEIIPKEDNYGPCPFCMFNFHKNDLKLHAANCSIKSKYL